MILNDKPELLKVEFHTSRQLFQYFISVPVVIFISNELFCGFCYEISRAVEIYLHYLVCECQCNYTYTINKPQ